MEDFPADLKFYWLHFEVKAPDNDPRWLTHLSVPQQTKVVDPQALVALFRQFLSEQEKHQRTPALEFIVLLILQQLTRDARLDEQADGAGTTLPGKRRNRSARNIIARFLRRFWPASCTAMPIILGASTGGCFI